MKLEYADLISPYPYKLMVQLDQNLLLIGSIKSPTLKEIWNPDITYSRYHGFIGLLLMNPQKYCETNKPEMLEWYNSLSEEEQKHINMMYFIEKDIELQQLYVKMLNFFFCETVFWESEYKVFFVIGDGINYDAKKHKFYTIGDNGILIDSNKFGYITGNILTIVCNIILQRCGIPILETDVDLSKVKSKKARDIIKKLKLGKKKSNENSRLNKDDELPNLITAISVKSNSINFTNVWDLTVYQFYEHFKREQGNVLFDIYSARVAAHGNEDKSFIGNEWYKTGN
ncbi:hypothetical protein [Clostridium sp. HBUAS56010]|uniref:hypothetical protein n=1 Tax=Clostridium sp. HBUAS56010 TaxID=2571127 RepID=UPI001177E28A|nr:hypothetical protein [Clostridium sp. HBUAS56010]